MFTFTPLDEMGAIASVTLSLDDFHEIQDTLQSALNYNPSSCAFAAAMEPARAQLGQDTFTRWIASLQKIYTEGECENHINFMFEDWISKWRISDFVDHTWIVADVVRVDE